MSEDLSTVIEDSARGSFFLATGNVIATVISAVSVFIIARLLGPQLYGIYTIARARAWLRTSFPDQNMEFTSNWPP